MRPLDPPESPPAGRRRAPHPGALEPRSTLWSAQLAALRREAEVRRWVVNGRQIRAEAGKLEVASSQFETAIRLAEGDRRLRSLVGESRKRTDALGRPRSSGTRPTACSRPGERLRFSLLGFSGDSRSACRSVERALAKFSVLEDPNWISQPPIEMLDETRRDRLISEINELLFLWVVALDGDAGGARQAVLICDAALAFAAPIGPWRAIRERCSAARLAGETPLSRALNSRDAETSARGCFQWALLCELEGKTEAVVAWLERATRLEPGDYWSHFYLGDYCGRIGQNGRAMEHYQAAVALRARLPWARCNRALLYHSRGEWDLALDDLNRALASPAGG